LIPLLITFPHSGESVPAEAPWLDKLDEITLMRDVDRYVDRLYHPIVEKLELSHVVTQWHRYAVDLNRTPKDIHPGLVQGAPEGSVDKKFASGLHWEQTTHGEVLMDGPMSMENHLLLVDRYYRPFHEQVKAQLAELKELGDGVVYHIDAHSMPSLGTEKHPDPGEQRAEIVISDCNGASCSSEFKDLVIEQFKKQGFQVAYNWPYVGGRITEMYGHPELGQHTLQIEINRKIYMSEETKQPLSEKFDEVQNRICRAVEAVHAGLSQVMSDD